MLQTKGVSFQHTSSFQLDSVDLHIKEGEIVSLIGPNGSGKSTLLRLISRLITPDQGSVVLDGEEIAKMKSLDVAKKLAMLPQMNDHQLDVMRLLKMGDIHNHSQLYIMGKLLARLGLMK